MFKFKTIFCILYKCDKFLSLKLKKKLICWSNKNIIMYLHTFSVRELKFKNGFYFLMDWVLKNYTKEKLTYCTLFITRKYIRVDKTRDGSFHLRNLFRCRLINLSHSDVDVMLFRRECATYNMFLPYIYVEVYTPTWLLEVDWIKRLLFSGSLYLILSTKYNLI